jgi:hypothetical protein
MAQVRVYLQLPQGGLRNTIRELARRGYRASRYKTRFHASPLENAPNILREGLLPKYHGKTSGIHAGTQDPAVYLATRKGLVYPILHHQLAEERATGGVFGEGPAKMQVVPNWAVFRVRLPKSQKLHRAPQPVFFGAVNEETLGEQIVRKPIPPEQLRLVSRQQAQTLITRPMRRKRTELAHLVRDARRNPFSFALYARDPEFRKNKKRFVAMQKELLASPEKYQAFRANLRKTLKQMAHQVRTETRPLLRRQWA